MPFLQLLMLCCSIFFLQLISFPLYAAEPIWVKDSKTGCLVFDPNPDPKMTVSWSGGCVDGKAEGTGEFRREWTGTPIPTEIEKLTGENGMTMVAGKYTFKVTPNDVRYELTECGQLTASQLKYGDRFAKRLKRSVKVFVKKDFALWHQEEIVMPILNMGAEFAQARCPNPNGLDNVGVVVNYEGDPPENRNAIGQPNYQISAYRRDGKWEIRNIAKSSYLLSQQRMYSVLADQHNQEINKRNTDTRKQEQAKQAAQQLAQAENTRRIVAERYSAFVKKNSVSQYVDDVALKANPFIYQGKTIALSTSFQEMLTADSGIFDGVVVSGLPGNLFTAKGTRVVLAGKVLGKTPIKTPFGEMSFPHLRFVDAHICASSCSDLVQ